MSESQRIRQDGDGLAVAVAARGGLGPGMSAALSALGRSGRVIRVRWSSGPDDAAARVGEWDEGAFGVSGRQGNRTGDAATGVDESRPGTRWRVYHRCGIACALLRRAGLVRRDGRAPQRTSG